MPDEITSGANTAEEHHPTRPWLKAPWKPGQSGNPSGRPKKITSALEKHMNKRDSETGEKNTEIFAKAMFKRAISRSDMMAKEIWDRMEGPAEKEPNASEFAGNITIVLNIPRPGIPENARAVGPALPQKATNGDAG
jgi:hypothetical protein